MADEKNHQTGGIERPDDGSVDTSYADHTSRRLAPNGRQTVKRSENPPKEKKKFERTPNA